MTNPYAPPTTEVLDVVEPSAGVIPANLGPRLGAAVLDGIVFGVMVYVPALLGVLLASMFSSSDSAVAIAVPLGLAGFGAWCWLTIRFVLQNGQSIAKKIVGIKVVRTDGSPVSLSHIWWLRNFVNMIIGLVPLYGFIDVLFIFGESRQCLHDKLADTIVVQA